MRNKTHWKHLPARTVHRLAQPRLNLNAAMNAKLISSSRSRISVIDDPDSSSELDLEDSPSSPKPSSEKKILLVDDDQGVRETLGRVLMSEGYRVTVAADGREAATRFFKNRFDLVLLDLNMPNKNGWDTFHFMNTVNPMQPVIVITARSNQYEQAQRMGVDALMEKPLDLPLLLRTVHDLLAEPESERTRRLTNPDFKTAFLKQSP